MSDSHEIIVVTLGDKTFRASRRTAAHLTWTIQRLAQRFPGAHLHVIQPCYNTGVDASEGTHDKDAVLDVSIIGLTWSQAQTFLRQSGWGAWWRKPSQGFSDHIHMVSLGYGADVFVGIYVPGQVTDYYNHAFGLEGMHWPGSDHSWFPSDIDETIFDYDAWEQEQEDKVPYKDWPAADKAALMNDIKKVVRDAVAQIPATTATMVWNFIIRKAPEQTARRALSKAANGEES